MNIVCMKDVPVEVDLGIEAQGYTSNYSLFGSKIDGFDMRRITIMVEGYQVAGIADSGNFFVESVTAPSRLNQKTLDAIEASEKE